MLNVVEVLIWKDLIGDFVSVNNVLKEYDDMNQAVKNLKTSTVHLRF